MKKKLMMMLLAFVLCTTSLFTVDMKANAEEIEEEVAYESLLTQDALIGNMQSQTWGVYLSISRTLPFASRQMITALSFFTITLFSVDRVLGMVFSADAPEMLAVM